VQEHAVHRTLVIQPDLLLQTLDTRLHAAHIIFSLRTGHEDEGGGGGGGGGEEAEELKEEEEGQEEEIAQ